MQPRRDLTTSSAAIVASLPLLVAAVAAPSAPARDGVRCEHGRVPPTTLSIEGNLYAVVRGEHDRHAFGGSGRPVSTVPEALTLIRKLGFRGTDAELFRRLSRGSIPGVDFADGGAGSDFVFTCRGSYRATALVRRDGRFISATRFWLRQGEPHVTRAVCMPEQWVPAGALVSISFRVPLARTPPVFEIDWNGDGKVDSVGPFRRGGAGFPSSGRCD
jgi:hypothetical protein